MKKYLITLLLFLSVPLCATEEKLGLGMWVWPQTAFHTAAERDKLLSFCAAESIIHLDQHVSIKKGASGLALENSDALIKLITEAHRQGVTVNALRGSGDMFFEKNHQRTLDELRVIITFNKQLPKESRLSGIKYDVEPYSTQEWKAGGTKRKQVMLQYLSFLTKAKALLNTDAPHLALSVDVPFWWDDKELEVYFDGEKKQFVKHVMDQTDYITLMSYRTNSKAVLDCVQQELNYAEKIGKRICPALETIELKGKESWISFHEKPPADFRTTIKELQQELSNNSAVKYIMLHHYDSLVIYLKE